jgi:hypothetical protein
MGPQASRRAGTEHGGWRQPGATWRSWKSTPLLEEDEHEP